MPFLDTLLAHLTRFGEELQRTLTSPEPVATQQQSLTALEQFIQNYYVANNLTAQQANKNIFHGIVEITYFGQHSSNGLLITEDGYILTAKHCVQDLGNNQKHFGIGIQIPSSPSVFGYSIEEIWSDQKFDIAIIKAGINGAKKPCIYQFLSPEELKRDLPIGTLSCWNGNIKFDGGIIVQETINVIEQEQGTNFSNHFYMQGPHTIKGDSGGIVLTPSGKLAGFISAGNETYTSAVKLQNALELVSYYIQYKRSQLGGLGK